MREAITNCLWLGNAMDARDISGVGERVAGAD